MEPCPGSSRYLRSTDPTERFLGKGGACLGVERWWDLKQHSWVAVKHLDGSSKLVEPELQILKHIADQAIPRTVGMLDEERNGPSIYVMMELVQGMTLQQYCHEFFKQGQLAASEDRMLAIGAQLFDTLQALHGHAHVAHMDLTSVNVMIRYDAVKDWDIVRVLDFGFSKPCQAGERDVVPKAFTPDYSAPEVLRSFFKNFNKAQCHSREVDGPPADMYSAGVVLFQMLTGDVPFSAKSMDFANLKVPKRIPRGAREQWQKATAVTKQQASWEAALTALKRGQRVEHPVLDKVRRCSSTPDLAADFFTEILHCKKHMRPTALQALRHPYFRECAAEMRAYLESQASIVQDSSVPAPDDEVHAVPGRRQLLVRFAGTVRKQGGRLARTAGHVLQSLPLLNGRRPSADNVHTACSSRTSSYDSSSSKGTAGSMSSTDRPSNGSIGSSSKPPLTCYFDYKYRAEPHIPKQIDKEASVGRADPCNDSDQESPRKQQPQGFIHTSGKRCSRAFSMQAWTSRQPAGTHQQTSGMPKVCARQVLMPVGQVGQPGHPKQPDPVQKEQACSALSAVPDVTMPCQPALKQLPAECGTVEQSAPVPSPSRPKRHGWMKKLAVAGVVVSVGCLLYSSRS